MKPLRGVYRVYLVYGLRPVYRGLLPLRGVYGPLRGEILLICWQSDNRINRIIESIESIEKYAKETVFIGWACLDLPRPFCVYHASTPKLEGMECIGHTGLHTHPLGYDAIGETDAYSRGV
jgi:hypothetical protein